MTHHAKANIDGGSRGNPGPAAYGFVIQLPGQEPIEQCEMIGEATNNVAEYTGLIKVLERAKELAVAELDLFSDSELLVKQMRGEYRVKNPDLKQLYDRAQALSRHFDRLNFSHVRREANKRADFLCNEALDGRPRLPGSPYIPPGAEERPAKSKNTTTGQQPSRPPTPPAALTEEAIDCLSGAANAWATHGLAGLPVEAVWEQLWSVLVDHNVLKTAKKRRG